MWGEEDKVDGGSGKKDEREGKKEKHHKVDLTKDVIFAIIFLLFSVIYIPVKW